MNKNLFITFVLLSISLCSYAQSSRAQTPNDPVASIQQLTLQWTGLEHQRDLLQANWRKDKPVLEQRSSLLQREEKELTALLQQTTQNQSEVEQKRLQLLDEQTQLEQEQTLMEQSVAQAALKIHGLYTQLPPPLKQGWEQRLLQLDDGALSLSEQLQIILELLSELDDFQRKITLHEAVMIDGETEFLVKQVYLGLSQGWYVSADRSRAARGHATLDGWRWETIDEPDSIQQVIDILERRQNATLVNLPVVLGVEGSMN
jgi:hypothetical protein